MVTSDLAVCIKSEGFKKMIFVFGKLNRKTHTPHGTNTMLCAVKFTDYDRNI